MNKQTGTQGITRRDVLAGIVGGATAAFVTPRSFASAGYHARIIRVESEKVWRGQHRDPEVVAEMINRGLVELTGEATVESAWKRLFVPGQRVGLKINLLGRPRVYTAPEIADAVIRGLILAGLNGEDIVVWDRPEHHFGPTAYKLGRGKHGETIAGGGSYAFSYKDSRSYVDTSRCGLLPVDLIPLTRTDVTVNLPVLKDHGLSGVTAALKNVAFGCYHTTPQAHDDHCDPFIAEAYQKFITINKIPIIILDATRACFDGGPVPSNGSVIWNESAVYLGTDPVALDRICCQLIGAKRAAAGLPDVTRKTKHIETAAEKGLGVADLSRIEVVRLSV